MSSTVINVKTDPKLKMQAQKLASQMGISLSAVINAGLKKFVSDQELNLSYSYAPSGYLEDILEELESGKINKKTFNNAADALAFLDEA
ncbi:MAG: type II toxin-antitoxin system RelB/DinJ family antitoxin [Candidatus Saccharimonadales bacterium]